MRTVIVNSHTEIHVGCIWGRLPEGGRVGELVQYAGMRFGSANKAVSGIHVRKSRASLVKQESVGYECLASIAFHWLIPPR